MLSIKIDFPKNRLSKKPGPLPVPPDQWPAT